jgi:hypothetical protein
VATGSALTHFTFVAHHGLIPVQDKDYAVVFMVPTNAKGVKLICRTSNEYRAAVLGCPFDYPLSSRLDENDAIFAAVVNLHCNKRLDAYSITSSARSWIAVDRSTPIASAVLRLITSSNFTGC